jgi:hypothetical protein
MSELQVTPVSCGSSSSGASSDAWRLIAERKTTNITATFRPNAPMLSQKDTAPSQASGPVLKITAQAAGVIAAAVAVLK